MKRWIALLALMVCATAYAKKDEKLAEVKLLPVVQKGRWGYIDLTGKMVIAPQFDKADPFSEGLAPIKLGKQVGYIDPTGKIVINPQFDDAWEFANGIALVKVGDKWGYIDRTGKFIWEPSN